MAGIASKMFTDQENHRQSNNVRKLYDVMAETVSEIYETSESIADRDLKPPFCNSELNPRS